MEVESTVSQHAAAAAVAATAEPEVLEVSEDEVEVAVSADEKLENEGGGDEQARGCGQCCTRREAVFVAKRKRGRPRKQRTGKAPGQQFMAVPTYCPTPQKRGRGHLRGPGNWQTLVTSLGNFLLN
ncbi:hypothetical protein Salat_0400200 [Sesamum alatum]|uniref:Uncharacterized protein n=1 Tax=Sesamum alatum TaxID=300844 RepID=A0AAE1Z3E3_9LAMI|nr:hypothetical protein Salat_0400200 [Sesamum alatum]